MSLVGPRDFSTVAHGDGNSPDVEAVDRSNFAVAYLSYEGYRAKLGDTPRAETRAPTGIGITAVDKTPVGRQRISPQSIAGAMAPLGGRAKRIMDIAVAATALVAGAPLILGVAVAVKINMGGPVIYRHRRIGFGGRPFECLKFRTMVANGDELLKRHFKADPEAAEEWRIHRKLTNDPRVTRLGVILRKTSLDELPQLVNIIRGDMSCVGPRPIVTEELNLYGQHVRDYVQTRPGMTGAWQVSGRSSVGYDERIKLDAEYVRCWSIFRDLVILLRTVPAVMKFRHAA